MRDRNERMPGVVAHELGHVANGSLWLMTAVIPVAGAITTGVIVFVPLTFAIPFGLVLVTGLRRIVNRPLEIDADRRAARAIGFRETGAGRALELEPGSVLAHAAAAALALDRGDFLGAQQLIDGPNSLHRGKSTFCWSTPRLFQIRSAAKIRARPWSTPLPPCAPIPSHFTGQK